MKSKSVFTLLLAVMFLFPGCYTILLVEDDPESTTIQPAPTSQPIIEYIPVYIPEPYPTPPPEPPIYIPAPVYLNDNPPSTPPPSTEIHREIRTGRGSDGSNPAQTSNEENNRPTRDSGGTAERPLSIKYKVFKIKNESDVIMKSLIFFGLLLLSLFLIPGCSLMMTFTDAFIEGFFLPTPPPPYYNPEIIIIEHPSTPPNPYKRRETHTGRESLNSNPAPERNDHHNRETRNSGVQRSKHADSNPAPARNEENNRTTRDSGGTERQTVINKEY